VNEKGRNLTAQPYVYVFNPLVESSYRKCVSKCPNETATDIICPYDIPKPSLSNLLTVVSSNWTSCTYTVASQPCIVFKLI
jgi:hypothetical protein